MKDSRRPRRKMRMSNREALAKNKRVTDDSKTAIQHANGGRFPRIQILTAYLSQRNEPAQIRFRKNHEVRMNVPAVAIPLVQATKHRAGQTVVCVEFIDGQLQPGGLHRMRVRVEQNHMFVPRVFYSKFGRFPMTVAAPLGLGG